MESFTGIRSIIKLLLEGLSLLILIRAVLSWFVRPSNHPAYIWLLKITDPVLKPFQRMIPPINGIDISPIIALLVIQLIEALIAR